MSPLSTPEQQRKFIDDVGHFQRRALWAIAASYLVLFVFVIVGVSFYLTNQDNLQKASCTGRLTVRSLLIFADNRVAQLAAGQPQTPELKKQTEAAHDFYHDAINEIDISDCGGVHINSQLPVSTGGGSP
jgi:hypothetical protein